MPPNAVEEAKERERRLASIVVLNENVQRLESVVIHQGTEVRKDINDLKAKVDEALLIGAAMKATFGLIASSIKRASQALMVLAVLALLFTLGHSAMAEVVFHLALEWMKHVII